MKKTVFSWSVLAAAIVLTPAAIADPPMSWGEDYLSAGEAVIDHGYFVSEPFYDGSYYVTFLRPSEKEKCRLSKTLEDYSGESELTHKTVTEYDFGQVDPATITAGAFGTVDFRAYGDEAIFERKLVEGGDFGAMIARDTINVEDVDEDVAPLIKALKAIATECAPET